uniref:CSON005788 protein n=1 Tax=Culicoides sonorensis TaxID=179676 RepID=A0A336M0N4_CULSO
MGIFMKLFVLFGSLVIGCYSKEWLSNANYYQIYPVSFKDSDGDGIGDLQGIKSKVPYLKSIGMDGVWLSPIMDSPMKDAGYDISDYRKINPMFGDMNDLEELIKVCKENGIHLILDFVPNQTFDMAYQWRAVVDEYKDVPRVLLTEAYTSLENILKFYGDSTRNGSHVPFNFDLLSNLKITSTAKDIKILVENFLNRVPYGKEANWSQTLDLTTLFRSIPSRVKVVASSLSSKLNDNDTLNSKNIVLAASSGVILQTIKDSVPTQPPPTVAPTVAPTRPTTNRPITTTHANDVDKPMISMILLILSFIAQRFA